MIDALSACHINFQFEVSHYFLIKSILSSCLEMDVDMDVDHDVPDFVRAWHPSVRRPIIPLDPTTYHEAIDPRAIFELRETPSDEYVPVVPYSCVHCRSVKQTCSRLLPCDRCAKTERPCHATQPGYQKLPAPKVTKGRKRAPTSISPPISASTSKQPIITSSNPGLLLKKLPNVRGMGTRSMVTPFRTYHLKSTRKLGAVNAAVSTAPVWTFIRPPKTKCAVDSCAALPTIDTLPSTPCTPRVWANSRAEIASIFPELTKSITGILWRQFEMPALFLEHPHPEYSWRDKNTLEVVLEWSYRYELDVPRPSDNSDLAARVSTRHICEALHPDLKSRWKNASLSSM
ncbi:uncharacterized protein EDB93DRAFT_1154574 [Suillus bovinus]|uniref:uncharacterized protein n=1 Tax=Suillus bovinus TaxID=48563 RepID=UPI001B87B374|nr:uncharacterized protein EDB93DRAFT_1154574 [Suillus bovinus]KAG2143759.1 hypothetical protein EDB93DRAFT_1154574 [Suillus bovinus]